jgi:hypothetical protein
MKREEKNIEVGDRFYYEEKDLNGTVKIVKEGWIRIEYDDFSHGDWRINRFFKTHISLD